MLGFIYSNQSILLVLGFILLIVITYFVVKKLSTKVEKKAAENNDKKKKEPDETIEISEDLDSKSQEKNTEVEAIEQESETESKKESKKPKIVQIYKRRERPGEASISSKQDNDPIYNRNVEFVNTSKNIAKFKSFVDEIPEDLQNEEDNKDEFGFVEDKQEDCNFCEDKVKHFDHSKRLSSVMKDDAENLFASHISDKYLNINSDRHLNLGRLEGGLFERADKMLRNSELKVKCDCENHEDFCNHDDCDHEDVEDVEVTMKAALMADTYFNRKRKK